MLAICCPKLPGQYVMPLIRISASLGLFALTRQAAACVCCKKLLAPLWPARATMHARYSQRYANFLSSTVKLYNTMLRL